MKKSILLSAVVLASTVVVTGCSVAPKSQSQEAAPTPTPVAQQQEKTITNYGTYSPATVAKAESEGKNVALFFHSKSCGSCAKLDTNLNKNMNNIPADLAVFKTDWDANQELAKRYNVDNYHTVAFLDGSSSNNVKGLFTTEELVNAR